MKKLLLLAVLLVGLLLCAGCQYDFPASMDEDQLTDLAYTVVETLTAGEYDQVAAMFRPDLQTQITGAYLQEQLADMLAKAGEYEGIKASATAGTQDKDTGDTYGVIVISALYAEDNLQYTMYFAEDYSLVGLYVK